MNALSMSRLNLTLGTRPLFCDFSLTLQPGSLTVLLGPNGCGKSTLLRVLTGEIASQAEIALFDRHRALWTPRELAQRLVVLPQSSSLSFDFLAREVVELGRLPWTSSPEVNLARVEASMRALDVWSLRDTSYLHLSGGERQRLHFARVLCQLDDTRPGILLLDEPTSALDPGHQHQAMQLAKQQAGCGHAVLMVLHDLNLASRYADRVLLMQDGRLLADGLPRETLTAALLHRLYGVGPELWHHPVDGRPLVV
ncbi:heme ABC transporter ATP-binding protein [Pseudaeromonas sharmana]|uniref:Heme ABC transporter ATP-binding protein n=1 Tax=Pseudaeromonas sharmana TaxID=328412 RepID=A0ABV8CQI9_9GAMM